MANTTRTKSGSAEKHSRSRLPIIPDLRFEYSYLRSIRPYFHIERSISASESTGVHPVGPTLEDQEYETINLSHVKETEGNDKTTLYPTPILTSEVIHVQWGRVIWITVRDQFISPLLQGAFWAIASYYITPFSAQLSSIWDVRIAIRSAQ